MYEELEHFIGKKAGRDSHGLLKDLQDLAAKYAKFEWLRNKLK